MPLPRCGYEFGTFKPSGSGSRAVEREHTKRQLQERVQRQRDPFRSLCQQQFVLPLLRQAQASIKTVWGTSHPPLRRSGVQERQRMRRKRRQIATERDGEHEFNNNRTSDGDGAPGWQEYLCLRTRVISSAGRCV
mmetsp:Transcript_3481/g.7625  ORF Transcript_3481/g.7625 Transcript_3481/m.7625 type:complete len:135 (-) Transcript_3481:49-453(-)